MAPGRDWKRLADFVISRRVLLELDRPEMAKRLDISERTLIRIEGATPVRMTTLAKLDHGLGLKAGSARGVLEDGTEPAPAPREAPEPTTNPPHEWSAESRAKILAMSVDDIVEMGRQIYTTSGTRAQILWLSEALRLKAEAETIPSDEDVR